MEILRIIIRFLILACALAALALLGFVGYHFFVTGDFRAAPAPAVGVASTERKVDSMSLEELFLAAYMKLRGGDLDKSASSDNTPVPFTVGEGESGAWIAQRLEQAGLVSDGNLFRFYMRYKGIDSRLEAGDYQLSRHMTMVEIGEALQHSRMKETLVQVIEGWRAEQVAEMLEKKGLAMGTDVLAAVRAAGLNYPALSDLPAGMSLEGYLFPDTYYVAAGSTPAQIVDRMVATFDSKIDGNRRAKAQALGLTLHEVVTLAAIVEREAMVPEERPLIAGVYLNRLKLGMPLQADPTVQYALGYNTEAGQWWFTGLTVEMLQNTNSPYNTYINAGLPPGPICNPGLSAIEAVLNPTETDYLYFMAKGDGTHAFSVTYEEHLRNQEQYRR
jgi:UPF0755 protein